MADNPITVPLPQDLPQNWTYGQTIGPQGTDVGLTKQHGYNYLMQQVNAAQQAAQELGAAFSGLYGEGDIVPATDGGTGAGDTQNALNNLGAGVRPNLLINGDFLVNQLGKTEYGTSQNAMDRWETTAGVSSLIVQQGYVTVTQNTTGGAVDQYLPDTVHFEQGETLTLSALVRGSSGKAGIQHGIGEYGPTVLVDLSEEWTLATTTFTVPSGDKKQVRFRSNLAGQTFDTLAVKLERGPNQTLAYKDNAGKWRLLPQPESDYDTELQKCQAYQLYFKNNAQSESYGIFVGVGYGHTENIARILLFTPVTLYGAVSGFKPTVTFNDLYIDGIGGTKQVTNIAVPFIPSENGVVLSCTVSETLTVGQFYILRLGQNGELLVDSN